MITAEHRAVACMKELRRERSGTEELRCPPGTTETDMWRASDALRWIWYSAPPTKPERTFTGPDWWLLSVIGLVVYGWTHLLIWAAWRIFHGA